LVRLAQYRLGQLTRRRFGESGDCADDRALDVVDGVAGVVVGWVELGRAATFEACQELRRVGGGERHGWRHCLAKRPVDLCRGGRVVIVRPGHDERGWRDDVVARPHRLDRRFGALAQGRDLETKSPSLSPDNLESAAERRRQVDHSASSSGVTRRATSSTTDSDRRPDASAVRKRGKSRRRRASARTSVCAPTTRAPERFAHIAL